jgi:hypothetical protein
MPTPPTAAGTVENVAVLDSMRPPIGGADVAGGDMLLVPDGLSASQQKMWDGFVQVARSAVGFDAAKRAYVRPLFPQRDDTFTHLFRLRRSSWLCGVVLGHTRLQDFLHPSQHTQIQMTAIDPPSTGGCTV